MPPLKYQFHHHSGFLHVFREKKNILYYTKEEYRLYRTGYFSSQKHDTNPCVNVYAVLLSEALCPDID